MVDKQRLRTFVLGGLVGALAGILLAPRSGRELRGSIANRAGEARERGRETYFEAQERLQERLAESREGPLRSPVGTFEHEAGPGATPPEDATGVRRERPRLREVSSESFSQEAPDPRSEELRRKVEQTRARLRQRLDGPQKAGPGEDRTP